MKKLEQLTTKLTLIIIGLTAGSALLIPATYASFHPVTTDEIAQNTIRSADISDTAGVFSIDIGNGQVASVDIGNGQVASVDIGNGQVASVDIGDGQVASVDLANDAIKPTVRIVHGEGIQLGPNESGPDVVSCPDGEIRTGGGHWANDVNVNVHQSFPEENGWIVSGQYLGTQAANLFAYAVCMEPFP
jgi:hypothetical protein